MDVRFPAQWSADEEKIQRVLAKAVGCNEQELGEFRVVRKNLDARKRPVQVVWRFEVALSGGRLPEAGKPGLDLPVLPNGAESVTSSVRSCRLPLHSFKAAGLWFLKGVNRCANVAGIW